MGFFAWWMDRIEVCQGKLNDFLLNKTLKDFYEEEKKIDK